MFLYCFVLGYIKIGDAVMVAMIYMKYVKEIGTKFSWLVNVIALQPFLLKSIMTISTKPAVRLYLLSASLTRIS